MMRAFHHNDMQPDRVPLHRPGIQTANPTLLKLVDIWKELSELMVIDGEAMTMAWFLTRHRLHSDKLQVAFDRLTGAQKKRPFVQVEIGHAEDAPRGKRKQRAALLYIEQWRLKPKKSDV
jgi:hypothetical protein